MEKIRKILGLFMVLLTVVIGGVGGAFAGGDEEECAAGYEWSEEWQFCVLTVPAGYIAKFGGSGLEISKCPAGTHQPEKHTASNMSSEEQGIECQPCPGGMTSAAGSTSADKCYVVCEPGFYLQAGLARCTDCPSGDYCLGGSMSYYGKDYDQGNSSCSADFPNSTSNMNAKSYDECYKVINLDKNGMSGTLAESMHCYWNKKCTLPSTSGVLSQTGYVATGGWGVSSDCTSTTMTISNSFGEMDVDEFHKNAANPITYYACKKPASYKITLDAGSGTTEIYTKYNSGAYLDSALTKAMSGSANGIEVPSTREYVVTYDANDGSVDVIEDYYAYEFAGYHSEEDSAILIESNGKITNSGVNAAKFLVSNTTWHASWTEWPVTLPTATRDGYVFNGWYNAASGGTKVGNAGGKYISANDVTLYAQWSPATYSIALNDNGGSGGLGTVKEVYATKWTNSNGVAISEVTKPTRTGYTFTGYWSATSGGTKYIDSDGSLPANTTFKANTALYAQWTAKETKIIYLCHDEDASGLKDPGQSAVYGENFELPGDEMCSRTGYTQTGWLVNGTVVAFNEKVNWDIDASTYYIQAMWDSDCNMVVLNNTERGGDGGEVAVYKKTGENTYYNASDCAVAITKVYTPSKTNATYLGTYLINAESGGVQCIAADGTLSTADSCNVSASGAVWYARYACNTNYTKNGTNITGECAPIETVITLDNQSATSAGSTAIYTKYATGVYNEGGRVSAMSASANSIAVPTRSYKVTYNAVSGAVSPASATATYAFGGYYSAKNGGGTQYVGDKGFITSNGLTAGKGYTANTTWYAKWTGGTVTLPTPTRNGYTFTGWNTSISGGGTMVGLGGVSYAPTTNIELYAQWSKNTITIDYDENGGAAIANGTCTFSGTFNLATAPTRTGYDFTGWKLADGTVKSAGTSVACDATVLGVSSGTTTLLTAQWTPKTYTCSSGQYLDGTACKACTAGYYCPSSSKTYTYNGTIQGRTACAIGYYTDTTGQTSCKMCLGKTTSKQGSTSCDIVCPNNDGNVGTWDGVCVPDDCKRGYDKKEIKSDGYEYCVANTYTIVLDKQGGTGGTDAIYEYFGKQFQDATGKAITTVTPPTKKAYRFLGFFTE